MTRKSYGKMHRTRKKLSGGKRSGITKYIRGFSVGDAVHIRFLPSSRLPHPRFHGKTGKITGRSGKSYIVRISDHDAAKELFLRPEHLTPQIAGKEDKKGKERMKEGL